MKRIFIISEGLSEKKYINALNAILQKNCSISNLHTIIAENFGGGRSYNEVLKNIKRAIKRLSSGERNFQGDIYIWIDIDVFETRYQTKIKIFEKDIADLKLSNQIKILYNHKNFEDFFILHYNKELICKLEEKLEDKNHFKKPLKAADYKVIFKEIIPNYNKGSLPDDFNLDIITIQNCICNIEDSSTKFNSEILNILKLVMENIDKELE